METIHKGDTIPFPTLTNNDTLDLSSRLEHQLHEQLGTDIPAPAAQEADAPGTDIQETDIQNAAAQEADAPETGDPEAEPARPEENRQTESGKAPEKTDSLIDESKYLRYIADLRKADSELALAKAESAELVRQVDNYREHYTEYEQKIRSLITEQDQSLQNHLDILTELAHSIQNSSESLSSRIDGEIQRLTQALAESIQGSVKDSCDQELARVADATNVLLDYTEKVKSQRIKFQKLENFKFALFIVSSVSAPVVLILFILNLLQII